jgi:hypothetical protein
MRSLKRSFAVLVVVVLFLVALFQGQLLATAFKDAPGHESQGPIVSEPVVPHVANVDLRTLPTVDPWQSGNPVREIARRAYTRAETAGGMLQPGGIDHDPPQGAPGAVGNSFSVPILNYEGIPFTGVRPPDTVGDAGPNHYIQMVNGSPGTPVAIYDKDGNLLAGPFQLDSLWTAGGKCASG